MEKKTYLLASIFLANATFASTNLLVNGSFETGTTSGWLNTTDPVTVQGAPPTPESGSYQAVFTSATGANLSQTFTSVPGTTYTVTFYLRNDGAAGDTPANTFQSAFERTNYVTFSDSAAFPYTRYSYTVTATNESSTLLFNGVNTSFWYLDNVSVTLPVTSITTSGLGGNNLILANYINNNGPSDVIDLFSSLTGSELKRALESAAPTRNAFATFAAQNGYLASSQVVTDHSRQNRFHRRAGATTQVASAQIYEEDLLADASDKLYRKERKDAPYTAWVAPFGEYAHEKSQHQTPAFSAGLGGVVLGFDYNCKNENVLGTGGSYVHTHIDQGSSGDANVDQGCLTAYGTLCGDRWYLDLSLWGGYYHLDNHRKISFTGFSDTAKSSTHGWQLAPHIEIGRQSLESDCFGCEPFAMCDWVGTWQHSYREHGAGVLNMSQEGLFSSLIRAEGGLRFHEIFRYGWGKLVLREKGSYAYQKAFGTGSVTAFLVGSPGSFTVETLTGAQNLGVFEFSMLFVPSKVKAPYVDVRYQGEFGSRYQSHQVIVELGKDF